MDCYEILIYNLKERVLDMTSENYTSTILIAELGKYLTQVSEDINITDRIVATQIALSKYSVPEEWKEITEEEAKEILAKQEEERQRQEEEERQRQEEEMRKSEFPSENVV